VFKNAAPGGGGGGNEEEKKKDEKPSEFVHDELHCQRSF
jgi:hypothetical protein